MTHAEKKALYQIIDDLNFHVKDLDDMGWIISKVVEARLQLIKLAEGIDLEGPAADAKKEEDDE